MSHFKIKANKPLTVKAYTQNGWKQDFHVQAHVSKVCFKEINLFLQACVRSGKVSIPLP